MANPLSILFVTSEVIPFAKVGGIADVSYSLPLAIRDLGHDVRVMLPKYGSISERKNRIHEINRLRDIPIPIGKTTELATVKSSSINNPRVKVQAYITTNQKYFDAKKGIYGNLRTGEPYADNDERFMFFSRSVIETCLLLGWFPDIIHCNDWQTAIIPAYAKVLFPEEFKNTKTVLTIHNLHDQGEFPLKNFEKTGLPNEVKNYFKHKNKLNILKGGIHFADHVTTVSKTYAQEIISNKKLSNDLGKEFAAKQKEGKFSGILNGIDSWVWNPKKDKIIIRKLKNDFQGFKERNKEELLEKFGLEYKEGTPVIGLITRIDEQKGIPLLIEAADKIFKNEVQIVILGEGNPDLKNQLKKIQKKYPDKFAVLFEFDEVLAHTIEAGSDMFLIPSMYEPCGLNSIYSLAYGSVPIVHGTGGLTEIVEPYDSKTGTGNGFVFKSFKADNMIKEINKALELFKDSAAWSELAQKELDKDYSWKANVTEYEEIYFKIMKED